VRNRGAGLLAPAKVDDDIGIDHRVDVVHPRRGVPEKAVEPARMPPPFRHPGSKETIPFALGQQKRAVVGDKPSGVRQRAGRDRRIVGVERHVAAVWTGARRIPPQAGAVHFSDEEIEGARSEPLGARGDR